MKKILLPYVFVSFIVVNTFASTSEFEGNWNVDKVDCTDTGDVKGRIAVTAMPKAFFCENVPSKIVLKFDANLSALVVEYLLTDGLGREYFAPTEHKSFKCPHCTFPWGELNLSDSLISYQEARSSGSRSGNGAYKYYLKILKLDTDRLKIVRYFKENLMSAHFKENTQTIYLSR